MVMVMIHARILAVTNLNKLVFICSVLSIRTCLVGCIWAGQAGEIQRTLVWLLVSVSGGLRGGVWLPVCLCSPALRDATSCCEPGCGETSFISVSREPGPG